jgi:hypothetical protein
MRSILITFAGILVFFAALSFNASANEIDGAVLVGDAAASQGAIDGRNSQRRFKDETADSGC